MKKKSVREYISISIKSGIIIYSRTIYFTHLLVEENDYERKLVISS